MSSSPWHFVKQMSETDFNLCAHHILIYIYMYFSTNVAYIYISTYFVFLFSLQNHEKRRLTRRRAATMVHCLRVTTNPSSSCPPQERAIRHQSSSVPIRWDKIKYLAASSATMAITVGIIHTYILFSPALADLRKIF